MHFGLVFYFLASLHIRNNQFTGACEREIAKTQNSSMTDITLGYLIVIPDLGRIATISREVMNSDCRYGNTGYSNHE